MEIIKCVLYLPFTVVSDSGISMSVSLEESAERSPSIDIKKDV